MTRSRHLAPLLLVLPLTFASAGCGTERADTGTNTRNTTTGPSPSSTFDRAELERRAQYMGSVIELIQVTEADGFTLAQQSVGVLGSDGFSGTYVSRTGAQIQLNVERGTLTEATCPDTPIAGTPGRVVCEKDGTAWYRTSGTLHEYARPEDGYVVRLNAELDAVDRDILRGAAEAARPAGDAELDKLLPRNVPTAPVERGDLPPVGDGAPNNSVPEGTSG